MIRIRHASTIQLSKLSHVTIPFPPLMFVQCDPRLCCLQIVKNEFIDGINFWIHWCIHEIKPTYSTYEIMKIYIMKFSVNSYCVEIWQTISHLLFIKHLFCSFAEAPLLFCLHPFHHLKSFQLVCCWYSWCTNWHNRKTHMICTPLP